MSERRRSGREIMKIQENAFPDKKYQIIYADPPWAYDNKNTGGSLSSGANNKYPTLSLDEIKQLPVKSISDKDCVLFLWATVPLLPEAFEVLDAWGFNYKTMLTWRKIMSLGMGYWFRGQTEHLLLGVKGNVKAFRHQEANFIQTHVLSHSKKPHKFRLLIEKATKGLEPRIELFARTKIHGWDTWGNDKNLEESVPLEKWI